MSSPSCYASRIWPSHGLALVLIVLLLVGAVPAYATDPTPPAPPAPEPALVTIDATAAAEGRLGVTVLVRGLTAGEAVWRRPSAVGEPLPPILEGVLLTDATGCIAAVGVGQAGITANLAAGDWTLNYIVRCAPGTLLRPSELTLLPDGRAVQLRVLAQPGWRALASGLPDTGVSDAGTVDQIRLSFSRFLLVPEWTAPVATLTVGDVRVEFLTTEGVGAPDSDLLTTCDRLAQAFAGGSWSAPIVPGTVRILIEATTTPAALADELLTALWRETQPLPVDITAFAFCDQGAWPLVKADLLEAEGLADATAAARLVCSEWLALQAAAGRGATLVPLTVAPRASALLIARALGADAPALLRLALAVGDGSAGGEGGGVGGTPPAPPFAERLAALCPPAAAALVRQLAAAYVEGKSPALPELPNDLLALGDPDCDGDGLPDRIDPAPAERGTAIIVDGAVVRLDVSPQMVGGRVMVPIRFLAQRLGLAVSWDETRRCAVAQRPGLTVEFLLDCHYFRINGRIAYLDVPAQLIGGRTCVPLRYAAKALNAAIAWDGSTRTVSVSSGQPYVEPPPPPLTGARAYLTFDDGPDPSMTPKILSALKDADVKATFFVIGSSVTRSPSLVKRIVAEGHALGNHSYSHITDRKSAAWIYRSPEAYVAELDACGRAISDAVGAPVRVSRPPGGSAPYVTRTFKDALAAAGYLTYDWDVSAADSTLPRPSTEQIIRNIIAGARDGQRQRLVILMHDGGRDHGSTLTALPVVIEYLRQCGYTFETLR